MEDVVFSLENLVLIGEALVSLLKRRDPALLCGFFAIILVFGLIGKILPVLLNSYVLDLFWRFFAFHFKVKVIF